MHFLGDARIQGVLLIVLLGAFFPALCSVNFAGQDIWGKKTTKSWKHSDSKDSHTTGVRTRAPPVDAGLPAEPSIPAGSALSHMRVLDLGKRAGPGLALGWHLGALALCQVLVRGRRGLGWGQQLYTRAAPGMDSPNSQLPSAFLTSTSGQVCRAGWGRVGCHVGWTPPNAGCPRPACPEELT